MCPRRVFASEAAGHERFMQDVPLPSRDIETAKARVATLRGQQ